MDKSEILELRTKAFIADLLAGVKVDDSIQNIVNYIMKEVGAFTHSEMINIYESGTDSNCMTKIFKWRADDSLTEDEKTQRIQERGLSEWIDDLKLKKIILIEDRESIRESMPSEYERMVNFGYYTVMVIPLYTKDRMPACMCLINPDLSAFTLSESTWLYLGQQIGLYYHKEKINRKYLLFMEGIRSSNLSEFFVDYKENRYEALRITKVLSKVIPEEGEWEWIRQFYASIIKPEHREDFLKRTEPEYLETFLHTEQSSFTIDIEREVNGNNIWFRLEFSVVSLDEKGCLERFVVLVKDITEQKNREEWMQYKMEHDELTGAFNRTAFNKATRLLKDSMTPFAFILLDVDKFKVINDTYGHNVGDKVLSELALALNEKTRAIDKVFRIGGDEFAVIMSHLTLKQSDRIKSIIEKVNDTVALGVNGLPPFSISAGATFSISGYDDMVYHKADRALYNTKGTTRRGCTIFEEMNEDKKNIV